MSKTLLCPNFRCGESGIASNETDCPKCGTTLLVGEHYRFLRALSQGGMGSTYLAQDERFRGSRSEQCVIKEIKSEHHDKDFAAMLQREAGGLLQLRHLGIPAYRDFFESAPGGPPSRWFLVQEAIDGETLQARIQQGEVYSLEEGLEILTQVLEILQYLHELKDPETGKDAPVIHLDIKPDNIMRRSSDGRVFLIDFGVSSEIRHTIQESRGAKASVFGYTMGYAPFEQTLGYAAPSSDLYALAMTFLVLLTGESPLALFDPIEQSPRFHRYVSLPTPLALLISRMLRVNLKERIASAREAMTNLAWAREAMNGNSQALQKLVDALKLSQTLRGALLPEGSLDSSLTEITFDDELVLARAETMESSAQKKNVSLPKKTEYPQAEDSIAGSEVSSSPQIPLGNEQRPKSRIGSIVASLSVLAMVFAVGWLGGRVSLRNEKTPQPPPLSKRQENPLPSPTGLAPKPAVRPFVPILPIPSPPPAAPSDEKPVTQRKEPPTARKKRAIPRKPAFSHEKPIPAHILEDLKPDYGFAVRVHALRALGEIPTKRSRWLLYKHMQDPQDAIKKAAARSLASMGALAVDTLGQAIKLNDTATRRVAAAAIAKIGLPARRILPLLLVILEEPSLDVRLGLAVLRAVSAMRPTPEEVWPTFYTLYCRAYSGDFRRAIGKTLVALRVPLPLMTPELRKDLFSKQIKPAKYALYLIEEMGPYAFDLLPMLQQFLGNQEAKYFEYATLATIKALGYRTLPFWEASHRTNQAYFHMALRAFAGYGPVSLPTLQKIFRDEPDAKKRKSLVETTHRMGKAALPFLQEAAKDKDPDVQEIADRYLSQITKR